MILSDSNYEDYLSRTSWVTTLPSYDMDYTDWFEETSEDYEDEESLDPFSLDRIIYSGDLLVSKIVKDSRMVALESKAMLIVDIDCEDKIDEPIDRLKAYEREHSGNYRVYKTRMGLRYIQSDCFYHGVNNPALKALKALGSDPKYIRLCLEANSFMARLTPKFAEKSKQYEYLKTGILESEAPVAVCKLIDTFGDCAMQYELKKAIEIHDFYTKAKAINCRLC